MCIDLSTLSADHPYAKDTFFPCIFKLEPFLQDLGLSNERNYFLR